MRDETRFASELAEVLGSLFRLTIKDGSGRSIAVFGHIDGRKFARTVIPFPNSKNKLVLDVDIGSMESAARVLSALSAPHEKGDSSAGPIVSLGDALERLIAEGEVRLGKPLTEMSRTEKQQLVKFLDERGAFALRKSVESVADRLGVSRFTVYNYLDAVRAP